MAKCDRQCQSQCDNCHTLDNCVQATHQYGDLILCKDCRKKYPVAQPWRIDPESGEAICRWCNKSNCSLFSTGTCLMSKPLQGPAVLIECAGHCKESCDRFKAPGNHDWVVSGNSWAGTDLVQQCWNEADSCCNPSFVDN